MKIRLLTFSLLATLFIFDNSAMERVYKLEGTIGGTTPVVIELEEFEEGLFSGWFAYKSVLKKNGDKLCCWYTLNPSHDDPVRQWDILDCKIEPSGSWQNVKFDDGKRLTAKFKNKQGKYLDVAATVTGQIQEYVLLNAYYKKHIGEMVCDIDMFNYLPIKFRLIDCMGLTNYFAMKGIYQTQGDIEYRRGMYWGSGYKAHECCDPAVVWAYDTDNNSFYVWIRNNGHDNWWSESGTIPIKFKEIVNETF